MIIDKFELIFKRKKAEQINSKDITAILSMYAKETARNSCDAAGKIFKCMNSETESLTRLLFQPSIESPVLQANKLYTNLQCNQTAYNWYKNCEDTFWSDLADIPDDEKVKLLLWKLETVENEKLWCDINSRTILDFALNKLSHFSLRCLAKSLPHLDNV